MNIRETSDLYDESLAEAWASLQERTPNTDFFQTLDWLTVYWKHYGKNQKLRLLLLDDAGQVRGIIPFVVRREWTKAGPFRFLTFPLHGWGSFYKPIGPNTGEILTLGLEHIQNTQRDWDLIELRWVDSRTANEVEPAFSKVHLRASTREIYRIPIVDTSSGWDAYWSSRSANWRSNCRRCEKKLAKQGNVEFIRYRPRGKLAGDDDPRWDLYDACEQIARKSWQGSSTDGTTLSHESVRPFLRDCHRVAVEAGGLDLNLLCVDGRPAAFNYSYHFRGYVSNLRLGFDPEFARLGVGTVLTWWILRDSFERGDHTFDFLRGSPEAKRPWQTSIETSHRYSSYARTFDRVQLLRLKRWLSDRGLTDVGWPIKRVVRTASRIGKFALRHQ